MRARTTTLLALVLLGALAAAAGLPEHRATIARVAVFAGTAVVAGQLFAAVAGAVARPASSPLQPARRRGTRPHPLPRDAEALLATARLLQRGPVDASLAAGRFGAVLRGVASHRLARGRALDLDDPADADAVRAALGDELDEAVRALARRTAERRPFSLDLDAALDRLDSL